MFLPNALLTIYRFFVRSHLGYSGINDNQPNSETFSNKLEMIQYNAVLAIAGGIWRASKTKLYKELGLEYLKFRR